MINVYAIFDCKADIFIQPWFARTDAEAMRLLDQAVKQQGHEFQEHAEDYSLWRIGTWDEDEGLITGVVKMKLAEAHTLLRGAIQAQLKEVG